MTRKRTPPSDESLGMDADITRKDFLGTTLLGMGAALLGAPPPAAILKSIGRDPGAKPAPAEDPWTGYGGIGDYAAANGNTAPVLTAAHKIRDGSYVTLPASTKDTGEVFDVVIVGGGISGLTAAHYLHKETGGSKKCLILENHPMFGGEARQNEFLVDGYRLLGPQGSNDFGVPPTGSGTQSDDIWTELKLPREFKYQDWDPSLKPLRFQMDNYTNMDGVDEAAVDVGYYFDESSGMSKPTWLRNIWANDLADTPYPDEVKRDLLRWRHASGENTDAFRRMLDGITYRDYLERTLGLRPEVTKFIEPVVGLINGASPDAVSAFASGQIGMPGVGRQRPPTGGSLPQSFPGGNSTFGRYLVLSLIPAALPSGIDFEHMLMAPVDFAALDRAGQPTRIRLGATAVKIEHEARAGSPGDVIVAYEKGGTVYRVKAHKVIMASGGWINKLVLADLPPDIKAAYGEFCYGSALVVNVALRNWRFLYKLGAPAARWFGDKFGFVCNIRRPMVAGGYSPPLHPDKPAVLTYYVGVYTPGRSAYEQGVLARARLLSQSYADYERQCREHMVKLFGEAGFNPKTDIAGIILNRWGHARVLQPPGFHYGRNGQPAGWEVISKGYGNIAIGHSELNGHQSVGGAMAQGKRAAEQTLASV
jgi:spermidine dehydrogenase